MTIGEFAAKFLMKGQKLVGAAMRSRFSDEFYSRWLMLNVPFFPPWEFWNESVLQKVPSEYKHFGLCISCPHSSARSVWSKDDAIMAEMFLVGHTQKHWQSHLRMVQGTKR